MTTTRIFHVSDGAPLTELTPRPSPAGTPWAGHEAVWGIDEARLPNYLVPRDCPRVCWVPDGTAGLLGSAAHRVVAIEQAWATRLRRAGLQVHELEPVGFVCVDKIAGYWIATRTVAARHVVRIDDCAQALADRGVELRTVPSLAPYVDAVVAWGGPFSVIRMRNATENQPSASSDSGST